MSATLEDGTPLPSGPVPERSVAESLRAAHSRAHQRRTTEFDIPGYGGQLVGVFRAVGDFYEIHNAVAEERKVRRGDAEITLAFAVDFLLLASVECFALIDGQKSQLPALGLGLYEAIFPESEEDHPGPQNDKEAMHLLFPLGTFSIVETATQLDAWAKGEAFEADEELLGES